MNDKITKKIIILLLLGLCFRFTSMIYIVNGESMEPSLQHNNMGLAVRTTIIKPDRFDIVVIRNDNRYLIKRVIGLPGEHIKCEDNLILVDNNILNDKYNGGVTSNFEYFLNEDEYFCLGDNRRNSSDSRVYGPFNIKDIKAISINKGE